jgi:S1-C subfamily serine protease
MNRPMGGAYGQARGFPPSPFDPQQPTAPTPQIVVSPPPSGYWDGPRDRSNKRLIYGASAVAVLAIILAAFAIGHATGGPASTKSGSSANGTTNSGPTVAVPASAQDLQQTIVNVVHTVQPSVVEVTSSGGQGEAIGSGVVLRSTGYIVTNDHVVQGFSQFQVTLSNGAQDNAQLVGQDPQDDLAVLKVAATNLQPINVGDSGQLQIGQFAIAIGSPLGLQQSATLGIVSALNRTASEGANGPATELTGLIQTSAPINPGNSGGALVNLQGQLIGIPTLGAVDPNTGSGASGIGFAIPSDRVKFVADQLISSGHLTNSGQGFMGIRGEDVTPQLASANNLPVQSGVLITGFVNDAAGSSPAQQAGLKQGDIIVAVNGQSVTGNGDLAAQLISQSPGTQVKVTIARGSGQQNVTVTLGERPTNLGG